MVHDKKKPRELMLIKQVLCCSPIGRKNHAVITKDASH